MVTVATTQKPSADVVPTFLRDLFGFRWALRCSTPEASDTILGRGWAS
jgi:DNA segregation ATPase FtsK/SpoIIIE-like protein